MTTVRAPDTKKAREQNVADLKTPRLLIELIRVIQLRNCGCINGNAVNLQPIKEVTWIRISIYNELRPAFTNVNGCIGINNYGMKC